MSKILDLKEQKVGDTLIGTQNFNNIIRIADKSQRQQFDPRYFNMESNSTGTMVTLRNMPRAFPWEKTAFGYSQQGPSTVRIYSGHVRIHGGAGTQIFDVGTDDYELTGHPAWVFVAYSWAGAAEVRVMNSEPITADEELRQPLYRFDAVSTGVYSLAEDGEGIRHIGDVDIITALRSL